MENLSKKEPCSLDYLEDMDEADAFSYLYAQDVIPPEILFNIEMNSVSTYGSYFKRLNDWNNPERQKILNSFFPPRSNPVRKKILPQKKKKISRDGIDRVKFLLGKRTVNPNSIKLVGIISKKKKKQKTPTQQTKWNPVATFPDVTGMILVDLDAYQALETKLQKVEKLLIKREETLLFFAEITTLMLRSEYFIWHKRAKNGKLKVLCKPNDSLRELHKGLIQAINDSGFIAESDYAWQSGRTMFQHFANHVDRRGRGGSFHQHWFIVDVKDAFENVNLRLLAWFLFEILYQWTPFKPDDLYLFLEKFFSHRETQGLARGLPASPVLFNVFMEKWIDSQLRYFSQKLGITYSRYGDDLVFSRNKKPISQKEKELLVSCISPWLPVNEAKTRSYDLKRIKEFFLHSIGLRNGSHGAEIFYSQKTLLKVKGMLTQKLYGKYFEGENVLLGYLGFIQIKRWKAGSMNSLQKAIWDLHKKAYPKKLRN